MKKIFLQTLFASINKYKIILFVLFICTALTGNAQNQKINLPKGSITIQKVFLEIEKQTDLSVDYNQSRLDIYKHVNIQLINPSLTDILNEVLKNSEFTYTIERGHIIIKNDFKNPKKKNETRSIHGVVKDEKGEPVIGANILEKGTANGVITNIDGKFSMNIGLNATLQISYIGYISRQIATKDQSTFSIILKEDLKTLDEVIVVGYGTQSKRYLTGSVQKIDMKQTEDLPNINVTQALRGRVAGVQFIDNGRPGQNGSVLIRGPRSLSGGNNPLIVLDGIFFNGSFAEINPNDISSMEVLKDASAAAIYGSRAANGVILITSKQGVTDKPTIRLNTFIGISEWSKKVKLLSPERYIQKTLDYRSIMDMESDPNKIKDYLKPSEIPNYEAGITTDPWDAISQQGLMQSVDVSMSGKTNKTNYYLSAAFVKEKGLIYNDDMNRLSIRANIENEINKWLSVGVNATYSRRDYSGKEASVSLAYRANPYGQYYYDDGEPTLYLVPEDQITSNPMRESLLTENEEIYNNLFANFYALLNIPPIEGLSYRLNFSPNYRWEHNYNFSRQDKHLTYNTTKASKFNKEAYDWVWENIISYKKSITDDHFIDLTLLYGRHHTYFESTTASSNLLASDVLSWNDLSLGETQTVTSTAQDSNGVSSMFRLNYRWKNRYMATFTIRRDGSSVFAENNKYATFPSGSLAWIITEENFMNKAKEKINMLKLRLSYGAVGNQAISPYQSLNTSLITKYVFGDGGASSVGIYPSVMANNDLKWETTYTLNMALDYELFNSRINGSVEFYNMDTKDLLVKRALPVMTGYNTVWANLGATNNKGIEFSVNSRNIETKDFSWDTSLTFSYNKNKIVHLYKSDTNGDGKEDDDLGNLWFIGQPINIAYDYVFDGIYQEGDELPSGYKPGFVKLKDLNGDGKIDAANDRKIIGQTDQPKYRWGITNTFKYKNLTLSVFLNAMQGWISTFNPLDMQYFISGSGNYPNRPVNMIDYKEGWWTPENKSNTRPSFAYTNPYSHNYYLSRNFLRIQDVSLTYNFDKSLINKWGFQDLKVSISGKNLHTFTKWPGPDPESGYNSASNLYPTPMTFVLSLNTSF